MKSSYFSFSRYVAVAAISSIMFIFCFSNINAGVNQWTSCAPVYGGIIRDIVISKNRIFLATRSNGIFYSDNGGEDWQQLVWPNEYVLSMAVDKDNPDLIYVGKLGGGVLPSRGFYRSKDGGKSWDVINMIDQIIRCLIIDPAESNIIYAGTDTGAFYSHDYGRNWNRINGLSPGQIVYSIAVDTTNTSVIYFGTNTGVFRSTDKGISSEYIGLAGIRINAIMVDNSDPNIIIAGTYFDGFYRSIDGGMSWKYISPPNFWTYKCVTSLVGDPVDPNIVYAGTFAGVLRSEDKGIHWIESGFKYRHVESLAVNTYNKKNALYAGIWGGGFHSSTDNGNSWSDMNKGLSACIFQDLDIDPSNPNIIYAGTFGQGFFRSVDAGESWTFIDKGLPYFEAMDIATNPRNSNVVYAAFYYVGSVFRSAYKGEKWEQVKGDSGLFLSLAVTKNDWVYAGTEGRGVYRSVDGGKTWTQTGLKNESIWAIEVDPVKDNIIYAGAWGKDKGVFISENAGEDWVQVVKYAPVVSLAIPHDNPNVIYAGTYGGGILCSTDKGKKWQKRNNGLTNLEVWSIIINPKDSRILYAGTEGGGVFCSLDEGLNWTPMNEGLKNIHVQSLVIDSKTPQNIYAGVIGGVYKYTIMSPDSVKNVISEGKQSTTWAQLKKTKLFQNYPNPFNPETWIPFELAHESHVTLKINDSKGTLIREISLGRKPEGSYTDKTKAIYWDGKNNKGEDVASGVYFYTLKAGDFMDTKKMIISR